jgi:hypothetical protein
MSNDSSLDDLIGFLDHASDRGLMPPASATALAVACRNVFTVLTDDEKNDITRLDLDAVTRRFQNKRAKDFSPQTLKEYSRRIGRAVELFQQWRDDPANFRVTTRATAPSRQRKTRTAPEEDAVAVMTISSAQPSQAPGTYQTAVAIGPHRIVTLMNVPADLTKEEATRIAEFVKMLAVN